MRSTGLKAITAAANIAGERVMKNLTVAIALLLATMLLLSSVSLTAHAQAQPAHGEVKFWDGVNVCLKNEVLKFDIVLPGGARTIPGNVNSTRPPFNIVHGGKGVIGFQYNLTIYHDGQRVASLLFNESSAGTFVIFYPFNLTDASRIHEDWYGFDAAWPEPGLPNSTVSTGRYNITLYYNMSTNGGWEWSKNATGYFYVLEWIETKVVAAKWIYHYPNTNLTRPYTAMNYTVTISPSVDAQDLVMVKLNLTRIYDNTSSKWLESRYAAFSGNDTYTWINYKPAYGKYLLEVWNATHPLTNVTQVFYVYPETSIYQRKVLEWDEATSVPDAKCTLYNLTGHISLGEAKTSAEGYANVAFKSDPWIKNLAQKFELRVRWGEATDYSVNVYNGTIDGFDSLIATNTTYLKSNIRRVSFSLSSYEGLPFGSTSKVEVRVAIYDAQARPISDVGVVNATGSTTIRVGLNYTDTIAYGLVNGRVRAYWKQADIQVDYIINSTTLSLDWGESHKISESLERCYVTKQPGALKIKDKSAIHNPVPGVEVYVTFPRAVKTLAMLSDGSGVANFTQILGSYFVPMVYNTTPSYGWITLEVKKYGVPVFKGVFSPRAHSVGGNYTGEIYVDLYMVSFRLLDAKGKLVLSDRDDITVELTHPTGVRFNITAPKGAVSDVLIPAGIGYGAVIYYKGIRLTPLEGATLNITTSGTFELKNPVYNATFKAVQYDTEQALQGLKAVITYPDKSTDTFTTNDKGYVSFPLVPVGSFEVVFKATAATRAMEALADKEVGRYAFTITDSDVLETVKTYVYSPTLIFRLATGEEMPTMYKNLTIVFTCNSSTTRIDYLNETLLKDYFKYESNQTKGVVFVGGYKYPLAVYSTWISSDNKTKAAIMVFNGTIELPKPAEAMSKEVNVNLYPVTLTTYDYAGAVKISGLTVEWQWPAYNITGLGVNELKDQAVASWAINNYDKLKEVKADRTARIVLANMTGYRALTTDEGKVILYIPKWSFPSKVNFTAVRYNIKTKPGVTPGVPEDLASKPVIHQDEVIGIGGKRFNVTSTPLVTASVYAGKITAVVVDYVESPLEGYTVMAAIEPAKNYSVQAPHIVATLTTDKEGKAVFESTSETPFWCNYSYVLWAYFKNAEISDMYVVKTAWIASSWPPDTKKTLRFEGVIAVSALDALNAPLADQLIVARASKGVGTGEIIAFAFTDSDGLAKLIFPSYPSYYYYGRYIPENKTYKLDACDDVFIRAYWTVKEEGARTWFWEVMIGSYPEKVTPNAHVTLSCRVYYAKFTLISDTGRALEKEALVAEKPFTGIPFKVTYYMEGKPRPDIFSREGYAMANATFMISGAPVGDYKIEAWWPPSPEKPGIKILDLIQPIESNVPAPGAVETARKLKCLVYDITMVFRTPRGTLLNNATVYATLPQGITVTASTDAEGKLTLINIPVGTLTLERVTWRGWDAIMAAKSFTVEATKTYDVIADNIVTLTVKVVGTRDQGLPYASVSVYSNGKHIITRIADESGLASIELPREKYRVAAAYKGKSSEKTVDLTTLPAEVVEKAETVKLDVYIELFGYAMSASEFVLSIVLAVIIVLVVAFIVHEYIVWRRKRIAAAVVRA